MGWWLVDLGWRGLEIKSDISQFSKVMDNTAREHFKIHSWRMKVFSSSQKGDSVSFLREIVENIKMADWHTFNSEAAAMHVFMAFTRDEEAKKACYKILTELPQGDVRLLMTKISSIEAFPDTKPPISVKPVIKNPEVIKKICTSSKYRGHLAPECWGRCEHCGHFGHKSQVCHSIPQPEPVKKTDGKKSKGKPKKKKSMKKENAKRVAELKELVETLTLNSPNISESETSDSDSSSSREAVNRVQLQQPQDAPQSRRNRRTNVYDEISDEEVINTLNRTKIASINKVKKAKSAKGMSYTDGLVSNRLDFRSAKIERLLLDSGAQVNIVVETIARDAKIKIIKFKNERFVTEASGNRLNIIGVCIFYIKLPCLKNPKKLECLVLRGKSVDREILISCEALLKWDLIHSTFGQETVTNYCNRINSTNYSRNFENKVKRTKIKPVSIAQLYTKSKVPTDQLLERIPEDCILLAKQVWNTIEKAITFSIRHTYCGESESQVTLPIKIEQANIIFMKPITKNKLIKDS